MYESIMYSKSRKIGNIGEDVACEFLRRKGYKVILRNYLKAYGEIDIVAEYRGTVRFLEVKTVTREKTAGISREMSHRPEDQIHPMKIKKIMRVAETYMLEMKDKREYQIDAVTVYMDISSKFARCSLFEQIL